MNTTQIAALSPILLVSVTAVLLMAAVAIRRNHAVVFALAMAGLLAAAVSTWASPPGSTPVTALLVIDSFSRLYTVVLLAITALILLFAFDFLRPRRDHKEEFYILVLLATLGAIVLVSSVHFISLLMGLEILSISLYALSAYTLTNSRSLESGIKYLVLASASAALMLFGMALIYGETGALNIDRLLSAPQQTSPVFLAGVALTFVGLGFKLALVPFHLWTPDVYQGAPLPVTALIATVSKAGVFGLLLRWVHAFAVPNRTIWIALAGSAIASMIGGNLLALLQTNLKRLIAYSSIAHMGYFLVAVLAGGAFALEAATYYLLAYLVTITLTFGVLTVVCTGTGEGCEVEEYRGLFWKHPWLAAALTAAMFSLAGIPLTGGFLGKFYVLAAGASGAQWLLVFTLIVASVIGLFYYLRVVLALYAPLPNNAAVERGQRLPASALSLLVAIVLLFVVGVFPSTLWNAITTAVNGLR